MKKSPGPASREIAPDPLASAVAASARLFGHALLFSTAMAVLTLTTSFYMLEVYDRVLSSRSEETLLLLTIISVAAIAAYATLDSLRSRLFVRASMRIGAQVAPIILRSMLASSSRTGGVEPRQGLRDLETIKAFIASPTIGQLCDTPFLVFYLAILLYLHWIYFFIVLFGGVLLGLIATIDQALTSRLLGRSINLAIRAHAYAEDGVKNADVLEGIGMSSTFVERWFGIWVDSLKASLAASDKDSLLAGISKAIRLIIQIALLGTGAVLVLEYHASGGIMIAASILGSRALAPIEAIVAAWKNVVNVRLAWQRVQDLLRQAPKRDEGMVLPAPEGRIHVVDASFSVPGSPRMILTGINFSLAAGESLGIIGPSASGKSTLVRLMVGAWPCLTGHVRLDGADIFSWPRTELSRYIGYLPQDVELFASSVRRNIARLTDGDPEKVVAAARLAGAHEMILGLPRGYDTEIGDSGHRLSGGQRQRIGIARALYGDPRFVVLDEPNSNLDAVGEQALQATTLELKKRHVTFVIVSHRPMTLAVVDKILLLRDGVVEAFGPRQEILPRIAGRGGAGARPLQTPGAPQAKVVPLTQPAAAHPVTANSELKGAET
ncbi:MAG TPA: type I secretion system permease/ATPase [Rhizomicrobium sp.]|nr:type I secretion system permease/ATPase [Rhizomicrobium sp.]